MTYEQAAGVQTNSPLSHASRCFQTRSKVRSGGKDQPESHCLIHPTDEVSLWARLAFCLDREEAKNRVVPHDITDHRFLVVLFEAVQLSVLGT